MYIFNREQNKPDRKTLGHTELYFSYSVFVFHYYLFWYIFSYCTVGICINKCICFQLFSCFFPLHLQCAITTKGKQGIDNNNKRTLLNLTPPIINYNNNNNKNNNIKKIYNNTHDIDFEWF